MKETDLIVIEQLPVIKERLKEIGEQVDLEIKEALAIEITGENYEEMNKAKQKIKDARANIVKIFDGLEERRKAVKKAVLTPYEDMEVTYKEQITQKINKAKTKLDEKISSVDKIELDRKTKKITTYFEELKVSEEIDFIKLEQVGLKINLSNTDTKLIKEIDEFFENVKKDLRLIESQEQAFEILIEYKETLNVSDSITKVIDRHKKLEEAKQEVKKEEVKQEVPEVLKKAVKKEEEITATMTVTATKTKLDELIRFLEIGGYKYE